MTITRRVILGSALTAPFVLSSVRSARAAQGVLRIGIGTSLATLDPLLTTLGDEYIYNNLVFNGLTQMAEDQTVHPDLAESWQYSPDLKSWTFRLRRGVKFHDGTPLNAEAFKANFDRQKDPANKCRCAFYIAATKSVDAIDELTLVYNQADPSVNLPALLSYASQNNAVQSPTAWKTKGDDYNRNPVGTGPYILKSWTAGDRMVLERNPNYWNKDNVYLDRIVLRPIPDAQSRFASLQ